MLSFLNLAEIQKNFTWFYFYCGHLLVNCGGLWLFVDGLLSFAGHLWWFVMICDCFLMFCDHFWSLPVLVTEDQDMRTKMIIFAPAQLQL